MLNPSRFKGMGGFLTAWGIYFYLPYITVFAGPTLPFIAACAAGLYGVA